MKLMTISDLQQPQEAIAPLISNAQHLSNLYFEYVQNDHEAHEYSVYIGGERDRTAGIHASELSKCLRQAVYSVVGAQRYVNPESRDANMHMRFKLGHAVHAMLQNDWKRICAKTQGLLEFTDEVRIRPDLQKLAEKWEIHSSCDGVFTFNTRDTEGNLVPYMRVGLEIKTASEKEFEKLKQPYPEHFEQTNLYMAALDLPLMWVLYYNKANSNITTSFSPWLFKFDARLWHDKLEPRIQTIHAHAASNQLPERQEGNHCRWCPFSWHCQPKTLQSNRKALVISPSMLPTTSVFPPSARK